MLYLLLVFWDIIKPTVTAVRTSSGRLVNHTTHVKTGSSSGAEISSNSQSRCVYPEDD